MKKQIEKTYSDETDEQAKLAGPGETAMKSETTETAKNVKLDEQEELGDQKLAGPAMMSVKRVKMGRLDEQKKPEMLGGTGGTAEPTKMDRLGMPEKVAGSGKEGWAREAG